MNESQARRSAGSAKPGIRPVDFGFDVESVRCDIETKLSERMRRDEDFQRRIRELADERETDRVQQLLQLMTDGYRVDEEITPKLFRIGRVLCDVLRLARPLDIFVWPSDERNAYCLPSRKGNRLIMCLNSGLLSALSSRELLFVMGHEVGHAILHQGETLGVSFENPDFSPVEVVRLRGLERAREISSDRVGLLACQDLRVASTTLFKVASGLTERWFSFNESAYARHFDHLSSMAEVVDIEDGSRAHPLMPLRVKALIAFANSETYARAFGLNRWTVGNSQMERGVETMLSVLEPDLSALEGAKEEEAANDFLWSGALLIIAADGVVAPEEVAWLNQRTGKDWSAKSLAEHLAHPDFFEETRQRAVNAAGILCNKLSERQRAGLLHEMCEIAMCGGGLPEDEGQILCHLQNLLDIRDEFARAVHRSALRSQGSSDSQHSPGGRTDPEEERFRGRDEAADGDPLEAVLQGARLTESSLARAREQCAELRSRSWPTGMAMRALVSWAVCASAKGGPITNAQGKRIAVSAIQVCRELTGRRKPPRGSRRQPVEKLVQDYGIVALFKRGEKVRLEAEEQPYSIVSVSRARSVVGIAREDDPDVVYEVDPHQLQKDPVEGRWPPVLADL